MDIREFLDMSLEDFRKETAGLDADSDMRYVLEELGLDEDYLDSLLEEDEDDCEDTCSYDDDDYEDDDYEDEDDDYDEVDTPSLTAEEEDLADSIVADIDAGRYTIDVIRGIYNENIVAYVEGMVD